MEERAGEVFSGVYEGKSTVFGSEFGVCGDGFLGWKDT